MQTVQSAAQVKQLKGPGGRLVDAFVMVIEGETGSPAMFWTKPEPEIVRKLRHAVQYFGQFVKPAYM
jgi:hypothetical protein